MGQASRSIQGRELSPAHAAPYGYQVPTVCRPFAGEHRPARGTERHNVQLGAPPADGLGRGLARVRRGESSSDPKSEPSPPRHLAPPAATGMGTRDQTEQCRVGYLNRESVTRFKLFPRDYSRQARTVDRCSALVARAEPTSPRSG